MNSKSNSGSLAKNTLLLAAGNILTKGLLFVMVPFFSRWLSTEDYGFFDLLCTYVSLLIPVINLATGEAVFRFSIQKDTTPDQRKTYISNGFAIVCINCTIAVAVLLGIKLKTGWIMAVPFIFLLLGELFNRYFQSYLRALKKLNIYSFCSAFCVIIISVLVTIFVRFMGMGLEGIVYGYAFGYIIGDICIAVFTKFISNFSPARISKDGMKALIRYSYPLIPNNISWWVINVSDRFVIKLVIGAAANGIYAISNKIPAICSAVFGMFNISWQQAATEIVESGNETEIKTYFNDIYNSVVKRLLSICIGILSCNFVFFRWIFDAKYIEGYVYSPILITAIIFMLLSQFFGGIQISLKMPMENGVTTVAGAICNIILNVVTIKWFGLYAAAFSTLISYYLVEILRKRKLRKHVVFQLDKGNYRNIGMYVYFLVCSYFINHTILSGVNFLLACVVFVYLNKDFVQKFLPSQKQI